METIVGTKFKFLTVISEAPRHKGGVRRFKFLCHCGNTCISALADIKRRPNATCGCGRKKAISKLMTTHGMSKSGEYHSWMNMLQRCLNRNHPRFADYGGRGITICDRWKNSFESFLADMGRKPTHKHSIDRKDTNGNYEPGNCRWASTLEQARNTRVSHYLTHDGKTLTISEWAEIKGILPGSLNLRIKRGWSVADALTIPVSKNNKYKKLKTS